MKFDKENKPGISNLLSIYCAATVKTVTTEELGCEACLLAVILIPTALFLPVTLPEKALLVISVLLLLLVEILNSAIEAVVDRIGMEIHPLAGRAKDMGSAAVFFALLILAAAWGLIALPALWALFF